MNPYLKINAGETIVMGVLAIHPRTSRFDGEYHVTPMDVESKGRVLRYDAGDGFLAAFENNNCEVGDWLQVSRIQKGSFTLWEIHIMGTLDQEYGNGDAYAQTLSDVTKVYYDLLELNQAIELVDKPETMLHMAQTAALLLNERDISVPLGEYHGGNREMLTKDGPVPVDTHPDAAPDVREQEMMSPVEEEPTPVQPEPPVKPPAPPAKDVDPMLATLKLGKSVGFTNHDVLELAEKVVTDQVFVDLGDLTTDNLRAICTQLLLVKKGKKTKEDLLA